MFTAEFSTYFPSRSLPLFILLFFFLFAQRYIRNYRNANYTGSRTKHTWSISSRITRQFFFYNNETSLCCIRARNAIVDYIFVRRKIVDFQRYVLSPPESLFWGKIYSFVGLILASASKILSCIYAAYMRRKIEQLLPLLHFAFYCVSHLLAKYIKTILTLHIYIDIVAYTFLHILLCNILLCYVPFV